jgi:16S rRNA (uracil1498-N3)-methyltransferase
LARYDFARHRLFVEAPLAAGARAELTREQFSYLTAVLRLGEGARLLVFNGRDGEWEARLTLPSRKSGALVAEARTRSQEAGADLHLLFAPLKHARLDYMAQKAVEMGASRLAPVMTRRTQAARVNLERLRANAIEAAEQCGALAVPEVAEEATLAAATAALAPERLLIFCDEDAEVADPCAALDAGGAPGRPLAVLIGPEGGFDPAERAMLLARPSVLRLSLGPRILRADTAAVAALALVQARLGDWPRKAGAAPERGPETA